ncbi:MAG: hypothetical protein Q8R92_01805 [Deltaproteobacteria bacterium]|nr:hypothetical protein [Deltaproteobacteria bacterium]
MATNNYPVKQQFKRYPTNRRDFQTAHTSSKTLGVGETGSVHTNLGASGTVTLTLPQNADKGVQFTFVVQAAQTLNIDPGAAGAIYIGNAKQADDTDISSNEIGECITLECDGNHDWIPIAQSGDWGYAQPTVVSSVDLNGAADALILDADGDTTISASTDDQIDIEISGADDFQFTANLFTILSGSDVLVQDAGDIQFGTGADALIRWSTGDADNHTMVVALGDSNQSLHVTDNGAVATDWNVGADTHPTVYIHSNTTPATDYMTIGAHDGTTGHINIAGGTTISFDVAGTPEATVTADGITLPTGNSLAGEIISFNGVTGANEIRLVTNLADALSIEDTAGDLIVFDTTTGTQVITLTPDVTLTGVLTANAAVQVTAGAATPAVALRFGATVTEGLEIKVYDETIELTNAVFTDTTLAIPAGAVILSVQANLEAVITGDTTGDNLLAAIGIGINGGDEDKYGNTTDLTQNQKVDTIPDWAVNGGETISIFGLQADGNTAATEKFTGGAGQNVRVRVVYAVTNSLDNAA